jgi:hypothetical protein
MDHREKMILRPNFGQHSDSGFGWESRSLWLRFFLIVCVALYSLPGTHATRVIVHEHLESHDIHHVEMHEAPDSHSDEHQEPHHGEDGEQHHHHLSSSTGVAMASVTPSHPAFFQRFTKLRPTSFDEVCPSGPVFELIKPPQVG